MPDGSIFAGEAGKKVAYREMEERGIAESLLLWMGGNRKGKPVCHGVRLFRGEEEQEEGEQFDIEIRDYGSMEGSLSQELYQMEHVILVTGVKCWELRELEQILAKFRSPPLLCMNFVSGREFFRLAKNYQQYLCLQVPYQPELLEDSSGQGKNLHSGYGRRQVYVWKKEQTVEETGARYNRFCRCRKGNRNHILHDDDGLFYKTGFERKDSCD